MMTLTFGARAAARPRDVWLALSDPALIAQWRPGFAGWIGALPETLAAPTTLRFRSRLRDVPVVAEQRVIELRRGVRMQSRVRYGLFGFEETFTLGEDEGAAGGVRIGLALSLANRVSVVSGSLDRFAVRRIASEIAEQTLGALCAVAAAERTASAPQAADEEPAP